MHKNLRRFGVALVAIGLPMLSACHNPLGGATTVRASVSSKGVQGNSDSFGIAVSANGRYVTFTSQASNLVPGDTDNTYDVFVRDLWKHTTRRVSVSTHGGQGNARSFVGSISADGRWVAFTSYASNLVPGDTNNAKDVFVRDLWTGTTRRVSLSSKGAQGNDPSDSPASSPDGRYVAFVSEASNLVPKDTNGAWDVFVRDLRLGTTRRVSVSSGNVQGNGDSLSFPSLSANGRYVAFSSLATNLVPGDTNNAEDVFVRDVRKGTTRRVSVSGHGVEGDYGSEQSAVSADGRYVAFDSQATNLVPGDVNDSADVLIRDLWTGTTRRVSVTSKGGQGNGSSQIPSISADGRYVGFISTATNLVPGDTNNAEDAFVRDRYTGATRRVSLSDHGAQSNFRSDEQAISADGRYVAFMTGASNLVPKDTNGSFDVFVRGPLH